MVSSFLFARVPQGVTQGTRCGRGMKCRSILGNLCVQCGLHLTTRSSNTTHMTQQWKRESVPMLKKGDVGLLFKQRGHASGTMIVHGETHSFAARRLRQRAAAVVGAGVAPHGRCMVEDGRWKMEDGFEITTAVSAPLRRLGFESCIVHWWQHVQVAHLAFLFA